MKAYKQLVYGTQEYLNELKDILNLDERFRELSKGIYNATELIIVKELNIGIWQQTLDGEIKELLLIPKSKLMDYEKQAELKYYIDNYNNMVKICNGEDSFISMVIDGSIEVNGNIKKLKRIQAPSERMEIIMRELCQSSLVLTKEQYIRWLSKNGYI
ncbi:MAG: hypothetical protein ACP5G1_02350 [Nanopusillaceae archaeon]|jgi:hypothetical protein